jgi:hypothetical protein
MVTDVFVVFTLQNTVKTAGRLLSQSGDSINDDRDDATIKMGLLPSNNASSSSLISVEDHSGNLRYSTIKKVCKERGV